MCSLVPRPTPFFFVLWFAFNYYIEHKPKNKIKKQGRPGNEASECVHVRGPPVFEVAWLLKVIQTPACAQLSHNL